MPDILNVLLHTDSPMGVWTNPMVARVNVKNLMLREEVVHAVAEEKFDIHAVSTIDEGIELPTGREAGILQPEECIRRAPSIMWSTAGSGSWA